MPPVGFEPTTLVFEDSSCLRPSGHCNRRIHFTDIFQIHQNSVILADILRGCKYLDYIASDCRTVDEGLILTDLEGSDRDLMQISRNLHGMTE